MLLSQPNSIVGGFEFAHMHTDGSLHASLDPEMARRAIEAGWAVAHPWAKQRPGWSGFVMIYTPTTPEELDVVIYLVESSYTFITGIHSGLNAHLLTFPLLTNKQVSQNSVLPEFQVIHVKPH